MAYEAMNNAGALHSRLLVILNDNDMSIAPPVGAMSAYLSRLMSSRSFLSLRDLAARMAKHFPRGIERTARRAEEYARGILTGGTLFEELGFYYVGPIDGHNLDHLLPVLRNVRDAEEAGPILVHAITTKGKGYAPAEAVGRQVSRRRQVQRHHRRAGQGAARSAVLHAGVRRRADRRGGARPDDRRDHRGDAVGDRARPLRQALSRALFRCRHRRAARGDVRGRDGDRGAAAVLRHLLDVPAAGLRPGGARRGDPAPAGAVRDGPGGAGGRRRGDARGEFRPRLSRLPAGDGADGAVGRGGARAHGGDGGGDRRPAECRCAIRAARGWGRRSPAARRGAAAGARAGCCGRAAVWRSSRSARGSRDALRAADELAARGLPATVVRRALRQAVGHGAGRAAGAAPCGADHDRGGRGRRVRRRRCCSIWPGGGLLDGRAPRCGPMALPDRFIDHDSQPKQIAAAGLAAKDIVAAAVEALGVGRQRPKAAIVR